jgi:lipid-A-disaccharide synthase-like uncharacterized protein
MFENIPFFDILGWTGAGLVLFGFYRSSSGKWNGKSFWYELDNFLGASFLIVYAVHRKSYVSVVLNVVWATAAFKGLESISARRIKASRKKRK